MHPDIKKFWEDTGHTLHGPSLIDSWTIYVDTGGVIPIYLIETVCHGDRYRFKKEWYSEEEMLRIIKLKAFT